MPSIDEITDITQCTIQQLPAKVLRLHLSSCNLTVIGACRLCDVTQQSPSSQNDAYVHDSHLISIILVTYHQLQVPPTRRYCKPFHRHSRPNAANFSTLNPLPTMQAQLTSPVLSECHTSYKCID